MIVVTAATGNLGTHVVEQLLETVPADQIRVAVRNPGKAAAFAAKGVEVVKADYASAADWPAALDGADRLLLISSSEVGQRLPQHQTVIAAAKAAGVGQIVYTSVLHADGVSAPMLQEHLPTEAAIKASGVPFTLLRNGWYLENYTENLDAPLGMGKLFGAGKDGKISAAARADYAAAAVKALTEDGHVGKTYELGGDVAFTLTELAAAISSASGTAVEYVDMPEEAYADALKGAGLPPPFAEALAGADVTIAKGELYEPSRTLSEIIRRPTQTLDAALKAALAKRSA